MNTITQPTPAALRAAAEILAVSNAQIAHKELAEILERQTGFPELLDAARALSAAYLDKEPTQAKADAWLRLRAAIRAAS